MNYDSKKKFFGSFFCLLSSINHDYSWYYLLYITHKGSNNSYLQSFKKKYVSSEIIGYFWITSHTTEIWHTKKSISLPQVLEINKNYWTGSDGSTIEPLNRGLNSYHALLKIYLPIQFNFLSWTWIQVYIIARFMQHFDLTQYQYHSSVSYIFLVPEFLFPNGDLSPFKAVACMHLNIRNKHQWPPKKMF